MSKAGRESVLKTFIGKIDEISKMPHPNARVRELFKVFGQQSPHQFLVYLLGDTGKPAEPLPQLYSEGLRKAFGQLSHIFKDGRFQQFVPGHLKEKLADLRNSLKQAMEDLNEFDSKNPRETAQRLIDKINSRNAGAKQKH